MRQGEIDLGDNGGPRGSAFWTPAGPGPQATFSFFLGQAAELAAFGPLRHPRLGHLWGFQRLARCSPTSPYTGAAGQTDLNLLHHLQASQIWNGP